MEIKVGQGSVQGKENTGVDRSWDCNQSTEFNM